MGSDESKSIRDTEPTGELSSDSDISRELADIVRALEGGDAESEAGSGDAPLGTAGDDRDAALDVESAQDAALVESTDAEADLAAVSSDQALDHRDMEDRLDRSDAPEDDPVTASGVEREDALEAPAQERPPKKPTSLEAPKSAPLIAMGDDEVESDVGGENIAAAGAAEAEGQLLSQELLDRLLREAEESESDVAEDEASVAENTPAAATAKTSAPAAAANAETPAKPEPRDEPDTPKPIGERAKPTSSIDLRRVVAAVAAGLVVGLATFTYLYTNQLRPLPPDAEIAAADIGRLQRAHSFAKELLQAGDAREALRALDGVVESAPPSPERTDATFTLIEATYRNLLATPSQREADRLHEEIDRVVEESQGHPREPEALYWKARLYRDMGNSIAARGVLGTIVSDYPDTPRMDLVLYEAAEVELELGRPAVAAEHANRLLAEHATSGLAPRARLLLGDAWAKAGEPDQARDAYVHVADAYPESRVGAQAFERLGQLALDDRRYDDAIRELETRLETATTIDGNDGVYLMLAKAYRGDGDLEQARKILNELIEFFPNSAAIPAAHVELSQVLKELGRPAEALRFATQAAQRFPNNPEVLRNEGELLAETGDVQAAARALTAADRAGAEDPALLLAAGKNFQRAGELDRARTTFERVVERFPNAPESIDAAIESARTLYDGGQVGLALARAEQLAASTVGASNQLQVLRALGGFYRDLGLKGPIAETYGRVASLSEEPAVLAEAAMGLLEAGAWDEGLIIAKRVDVTQLDAETAYALLMRKGKTLLRVNPSEALNDMDRAFTEYPEQRTAAGDVEYLRANLATGRSARARILVEEVYRDVQQKQTDPKRLVAAAVAYGNFLFERGDFRAASDAYVKALYPAYRSDSIEGRPIIPLDDEQHWAMYQRANALLNLSQFEDSLALYDQVAAMNGPWTSEAKARASSARLELRLRGGANLRGDADGRAGQAS